MATFQDKTVNWFCLTFGAAPAMARLDRLYAFGEEAVELLQAGLVPREEAHAIVDFVYNKPPGQVKQELPGVYMTLAMVAHSFGEQLENLGIMELARVYNSIDLIRQKQTKKLTPHNVFEIMQKAGEASMSLTRDEVVAISDAIYADLKTYIPEYAELGALELEDTIKLVFAGEVIKAVAAKRGRSLVIPETQGEAT